MSFDQNKYYSNATIAEASYGLLQTSIALTYISSALLKLAKESNVDISSQIDSIRDAVNKLDRHFDEITGYVPDAE